MKWLVFKWVALINLLCIFINISYYFGQNQLFIFLVLNKHYVWVNTYNMLLLVVFIEDNQVYYVIIKKKLKKKANCLPSGVGISVSLPMLTLMLIADLEKTNSMNSAEFNLKKDLLPYLSNFLPNLDPQTRKLEIT